MGGQIVLYYDCVSPYGFFAFHYLMKNREALSSHDIKLEMRPVFQGGVIQISGNKPPFSVAAKGAHGNYDRKRAMKYFGLQVVVPSSFPFMSLLPQRCLTYIKEKYGEETLEKASLECWRSAWQQDKDISKPEVMQECLATLFSSSDAQQIVQEAHTPEVKSKLLATTEEALAHGAYGTPWFMVTNHKGDTEPFFGSDRFHHMWDFLGLPWTDMQLQAKSKI